MEMQKNGQLLPKKDAMLMVLDVIDILGKEPTVVPMSIPSGASVNVVGDTHGQYWDFFTVLGLTGKPSSTNPVIFNGDMVDRGSWSIEVVLSIFAMKLKDPQYVGINRGNHEMLEANVIYGFCGECEAKYGLDLFDLFSEAFRRLPLAHLVESKIFVVHAGPGGPDPRIWMPGQTHDPTDSIPLNENLPTLATISSVDRMQEVGPDAYKDSIGPSSTDKQVVDERLLIDMLWSDPRGGPGYGPSYRKSKGVYMYGPDVTELFCNKNNLQAVIRSHEVKADGYRWDHPKLCTVFSAPNYLDTGNNKGAILKLSQAAPGSDITVTPSVFEAAKHPDLPPMHWQSVITDKYPHLTRKMKKKGVQQDFDEFGDSDFAGLMNFDEWEPDEAEAFQDAFKLDEYGRELPGNE
jgi:serine/threonine-protein phosphatase 5